MKKIMYYAVLLLLFFVSCENTNENTSAKQEDCMSDEKTEKEMTQLDSAQTSDGNNAISRNDIYTVSEKMKKQAKLTETDYATICDFMFNNVDESLSEEIGYRLFEYLKSNQLNNDAFILYLNEKEISYKENIKSSLVEIMCIDIGEENYSYDTFIKDFDMFKNSISAKRAFDECMDKQ
jgi:hypothetical protein